MLQHGPWDWQWHWQWKDHGSVHGSYGLNSGLNCVESLSGGGIAGRFSGCRAAAEAVVMGCWEAGLSGGEMWVVAVYGLLGDKYDTYADSNVTSIFWLFVDKKLGYCCG